MFPKWAIVRVTSEAKAQRKAYNFEDTTLFFFDF